MNPWKRNLFIYEAHMRAKIINDGYEYTIKRTVRLDWFSYHLIKWIHGEQKLIQMAEVDRDEIHYRSIE